MTQELLRVTDLKTEFQRGDEKVYAVNGVSFSLREGETLGIVGESGSGKSVTVHSMLGLLQGAGKVSSGQAIFQNRVDLLQLRRKQLEDIRGRDIGVIFQDPMTSLNPTMRIGNQIMEGMLTHQYATRKKAFERTLDLLHEVGIPEPKARFRNFPFEFSGGMRQRVMIAMAIACEPQLLIADEPTTALDVTVQMQILALMQKLKQDRKMSVLMITHDFGVATNFCDRILVMYGGKVMEAASLDTFIRRPLHPYTIALKSSIIEVGDRHKKLQAIPGMAKVWNEPPHHCPFYERCTFATQQCLKEVPELTQVDDQEDHWLACHHVEEVLKSVG